MNLIRRLATCGAIVLVAASSLNAQIIERPVPFDSAGLVTVMTPYIAQRADLRAPWWPVSGDFTEARLYTVNDSTYVLTVGRRTGVVERYNLSAADRAAIGAIISKLPREVIAPRHDARNAFVRNQTLLGLLVYAPTFAGSFANNSVGATAGYLVVAGGTFFAASEISRDIFVSRAQSDLSTNLGRNGALAGWAATYLFHVSDRGQSAGAFVGGVTGAGIALRAARNMTEADAIGAGFGGNISALIAWGTMEAVKGESRCKQQTNGSIQCGGRISDRAEVATILASGLIGYPLGVLYPRNARYNVTPGDIQTLYATTSLGIVTAAAFLPRGSSQSAAFATGTGGGIVGLILGDRFLVQRFDHSRSEAGRVTLGTYAGGLMGAGVAALIDTNLNNPHLVLGFASGGALLGLIASEHYVDASPDAGRRGPRLSFNPGGIFLIAARAPGNHSLLNVRF